LDLSFDRLLMMIIYITYIIKINHAASRDIAYFPVFLGEGAVKISVTLNLSTILNYVLSVFISCVCNFELC